MPKYFRYDFSGFRFFIALSIRNFVLHIKKNKTMADFYALKVQSIKKLTPSAVAVTAQGLFHKFFTKKRSHYYWY